MPDAASGIGEAFLDDNWSATPGFGDKQSSINLALAEVHKEFSTSVVFSNTTNQGRMNTKIR
jgi:hypothetical protein